MRRVIWSAEAQRDNLEILRYIAADNPLPPNGSRMRSRTRGTSSANLRPAGRGASGSYEKSVPRHAYIIAYELRDVPSRGEVIAVVRVIHTSRDWPAEEWPTNLKT
jgi:plasmid stabilization system protein ParE